MRKLLSSRPRALVTGIVLATSVLVVGAASATNGYLIHGIGGPAKGLAGASVAFPQDALIGAVNPAGMAFVGKRYDIGLAVFNPNREYTVSGQPSGFPTTFGLVPGTVESDSEYFFVPNFAGNWEIGNDATFGLLVYGQGGMNTDWPTATFFGSSPTGVDLSQMFVVPTYSKKLNDNHGLGIGLVAAFQIFEAKGMQAFGPFSSDPTRLTNNSHDDSYGFGARVGYFGRFSPAFSFGIGYQTEISMSEFDDYAGLFAGRGSFDIPSNASVGFAWDVAGSTTFSFEVQEIYYSDIKSVGNPMLPNLVMAPLGADNGAGFGWEDMTVYKAGLQWSSSDTWTWRLGVSTGDQPIPGSEVMFNILAPGVVEEHIAFGFTRLFRSRTGAFNFALTHAPSVSVNGGNPLEVPGFQTIELEMNQWDLEIGYSWAF